MALKKKGGFSLALQGCWSVLKKKRKKKGFQFGFTRVLECPKKREKKKKGFQFGFTRVLECPKKRKKKGFSLALQGCCGVLEILFCFNWFSLAFSCLYRAVIFKSLCIIKMFLSPLCRTPISPPPPHHPPSFPSSSPPSVGILKQDTKHAK